MKSAQGKKKIKVGRAPKYKTPEELQRKINEYFEKGIAVRKVIVGPANNRTVEEIPIPTICGLVLYLGFCDRQSFYDLEKLPDFSYTIKKARLSIEEIYEALLHGSTPTGAIFALKNFDWKDKQDIEHLMADSTIEKFAQLSVSDLLQKANALIGKSTSKS